MTILRIYTYMSHRPVELKMYLPHVIHGNGKRWLQVLVEKILPKGIRKFNSRSPSQQPVELKTYLPHVIHGNGKRLLQILVGKILPTGIRKFNSRYTECTNIQFLELDYS
jgi:hypothetical protein